MIWSILDTTGRHLGRLLIMRHAATTILIGTLAFAAGGAMYLNPAGDHDGQRACPATGLIVTGTPLAGSYSYHRCDYDDEDGR